MKQIFQNYLTNFFLCEFIEIIINEVRELSISPIFSRLYKFKEMTKGDSSLDFTDLNYLIIDL